jgi:hypothetical protein
VKAKSRINRGGSQIGFPTGAVGIHRWRLSDSHLKRHGARSTLKIKAAFDIAFGTISSPRCILRSALRPMPILADVLVVMAIMDLAAG